MSFAFDAITFQVVASETIFYGVHLNAVGD